MKIKVDCNLFILLLLPLMILAGGGQCAASGFSVMGTVTDSITGEALRKVTVRTISGKKETATDSRGHFKINVPDTTNALLFSASGYSEKRVDLKKKDAYHLQILLSPRNVTLEEVVIRPHKQKYSKKNNPAVDLMQRIRSCAGLHNPINSPYFSYDKYEKTVLGLNNYNIGSDTSKKVGKTEQIFMECIDTAVWTGKRILVLSLKEQFSTRITSTDNAKIDKEIIVARRNSGIDESFNQDNIMNALADAFREINIYENDITLLQNRFVSPLSKIGADFYKYYITDTVAVDGMKCTELTFVPRTPETFGFNGKLFVVDNDSACYVKRVTMRVPHSINLNYISNIFISQNYKLDSLGYACKTYDDLTVEITPVKGLQQFYCRRETFYANFSYKPHPVYNDYYHRLGTIFEIDETPEMTFDWPEMRMVSLSRAEIATDGLMSSIRKNRFFVWTEKVLEVLVKGYIRTARDSKFDIGPVNTMISYNSTEGLRLRFGGMTTANLSKHLFARGYGAYGFRDHKWKYMGELEYSFTPKKYHSREFPINSIRLTHSYDIDKIGQHYLFTNADNVFLSFKRMESNLTTYRRYSEFLYTLELPNNFSINAAICHQRQESTPWLPFIDGNGKTFSHFNNLWFKVALRYAPGEKYVQGTTARLPINMDAPVFQLTHEIGPDRFMGSSFCINRTELSVSKRLWLSAFGYMDFIIKGGIVWSQVQYPSLIWPNANLSYTIQPESYSLMNPMEFANDKYASIDYTYWINGALFNRIPILKKAKLREIITFKALWGGLSRRNNPEYNENLFRFPVDAHSEPMRRTPYMEIGAGIDNILTILRVDYVWRLTYRDLPGIDKNGLRISLHFSF